ncbi:MAG: 50S ribosomal protein L15 [Parasphingorhabdus sp.]|uniref:50S ribosomal protein L15 n=1 Tax=Parasphingorhabdus sp. TaxID=2709688 RepID=UPI003298D28C
MKLNEIRDNDGARKLRTRVGRGIGSGKGKTGGRGQKGQKSRSGVSINGFEGGQMPLHMRIPKRGFNNPFGNDYAEVNIGMIQKYIDSKKLANKGTLDQAALDAVGLTRGGKDGVRLLAKGELKAKITIAVAGASKAAIEAVEKAGGKVEILAGPAAHRPKGEKKAVASKPAKEKKAANRAKKKD